MVVVTMRLMDLSNMITRNMMNSRLFLVIVGFAGIAASLGERPIISGTALMFCVVNARASLVNEFDSIVSNVVLVLTPFVVGIATLLCGSVLTPLPRVFLVISVYIGLIFVSQIFGNPKNQISIKHLVIPVFIFLSGFLISLLSTSKLITFIAFGYDNFYHLAIFRNMANSRMLLVGGEGLMSVVNSGPLGSGAALSLISEVIGVNPLDVRQSVQFFATISLLIPLTIFFVVNNLVKLLLVDSSTWHASFLVAAVFFIGYPSHQWFSGFLHSNVGILLVVIGLLTYLGVESNTLKSALLSVDVVVLAFVYLIYVPVVAALLVKVVFFDLQRGAKRERRLSIGFTGLALSVTVFPVLLLRRSYGVDHLFVGGGIEQIPQVPTALLLGYGIGLAYESTRHGINQRRRILPHTLILLIVILSALSIWHSSYISYYPTKYLVLLLIPTLTFIVSETSFQIQRNLWNAGEKLARSGMLVLIVSLQIWSGLSPKQYQSGDQGALRGVIAEIFKPERESDRGKFILALHLQAELVNRPVLVEVQAFESEQMSRWVSSLGFRFSDTTWTDWTAVRTNYSIEEYAIAYKIASGDPLYSNSGKGVLIATDNPKMLFDLRKIGPEVYGCLISKNFLLTCK